MSVLNNAESKPGSALFLKSIYENVSHDDLLTYAAALAFYMATAMAPLFMLLIVALALLDLDYTQQLLNQINALAGEDAAKVFASLSESVQKQDSGRRASGGIIAVVFMIISSSVIFEQLKTSIHWIFKDLYEPLPELTWMETMLGFLKARFMSMFMMVAFVIMIILSLAASFIIEYLPVENIVALKLLNISGDLLVFTFLFAILFKVLPNISVSFTQSLWGAVVTAILFVFGKDLVGLYLRTVAAKSAYGAAGLPMTLFIWLYYTSFIILLGAETIATLKVIREGEQRI